MAIELRKTGDKVNLTKSGPLGKITVNLNWNTKGNVRTTGVLFKKTTYDPIDLDLGCLYELTDGTKMCVQALGNSFGRYDSAPYIMLDGDDRTGSSGDGENLRINGDMISKIKRVLVYTFIYEGVANWRDANAVVTVKCPGSQDIVVRMDQFNTTDKMCVIAMLENVGSTFSVEKIVRFFNGHEPMDRAFNWGLKWVPGRKE